MPAELSLAVVGADYPNSDGGNRRSEIMFCDPGEPIKLRPEPKNKVDPNAVAVYSVRGFQIGYLTAERAPWIGAAIRSGAHIEAVFQRAATFGAWIRVNLEGEPPTLPPVPDNASVGDEICNDEFRQEEPDYSRDWIPSDD